MARLLLGVSGGIAAYKALEFARLATKAGHGLRVVMTPAAERFVGRASFEGIVGAPVLGGEFDRDPARGAYPGEPAPDHDPIGHLALAERAEAMIVAPASANTLAKLAAGFADSMLTTSFLACTAPRLVAPAMNDRMWADGATAANAETLRSRGVQVLEPEAGALASRGEWGAGRLPEPERLLAAVDSALGSGAGRPWTGLRVLVSAGGTREPIDAVRFIGNRSSGRMGLALAAAAAARGAGVELIAANVSLPEAAGVARTDVETTAELGSALAERFETADVLLMAAAVADFRPDGGGSAGKLTRDAGVELRLEPTEDLLAGLAARRRADQVLVGFAAEHGPRAIERAREKLGRKAVDAVVFNDVSRSDIGFDAENNEVTIVEADGDRAVGIAPKADIAAAVLDRVDAIRAAAAARLREPGGRSAGS